MPKPYSVDIRARVIARVEAGASRREAAEHFEISASAAVKWVKLFHETGRCAAKPFGGSTSPLEEHADFLLTFKKKVCGRPNRNGRTWRGRASVGSEGSACLIQRDWSSLMRLPPTPRWHD